MIVTLLLGMACAAQAVDRTWTGNGGDMLWTNAANWNPSTYAPLAGDTALIDANDIVINTTVNASRIDIATANGEHGSLYFNGSLDMTTGALYQWVRIGLGTAGSSITAKGYFHMESGNLVLGNATYGAVFNVGVFGHGVLNMSGGTITLGNGYFTVSDGEINMTGGTITADIFKLNEVPGSGTAPEYNSVVDLAGGTIIVTSYRGYASMAAYQEAIAGWIADGSLIAYGGTGVVQATYDGDQTTLVGVEGSATQVSITTQPVSQIADDGDNVTLFVVAETGGAGTLAYQWYKDGVALSDGGNFSGSNDPCLVITSADSLANNGGYRCHVTTELNPEGAYSLTAALRVVLPYTYDFLEPYDPVNGDGGWSADWKDFSRDEMNDGLTYIGQNYGAAGSGLLVVRRTPEPPYDKFTVYCDLGSVMDIGVLSTYHNAQYGPENVTIAVSSLAAPDQTDPDDLTDWTSLTYDSTFVGNGSTNINRVQLTSLWPAGGARWVRMIYRCNHPGWNDDIPMFFEFELSDYPVPQVTSQPSNVTAVASNQAQFTVAAIGKPTLSYAWYHDGDLLSDGGDISGATTTQLTVANVVPDDQGDYYCVVTNSEGSATSNVASLTVSCNAEIDGDINVDCEVNLEDLAAMAGNWLEDSLTP